MSETKTYSFVTMDGLGNDFIVFDTRGTSFSLTPEEVQLLADREDGIGCDQLIIVRDSDNADAFMEIRNADGSEVSACGNATRCVAWLLADGEEGADVSLETKADVLNANILNNQMVTVDMGEPRLNWQDIPLAVEMDTLSMDLELGELHNPVGVSMGNPHAIFFVDDVNGIALEKLGPALETHPVFPERANISVCSVDGDTIIQRVWERGVGITQACGTGACAALVAAHRRGLTDRSATVQLEGGVLKITWRDDNRVMMTGAVRLNDEGTVTL